MSDWVQRYRNPRSGIIHNADPYRLVTHCGAVLVDLFATYDYGLMTMGETEEPATCKVCLRGVT